VRGAVHADPFSGGSESGCSPCPLLGPSACRLLLQNNHLQRVVPPISSFRVPPVGRKCDIVAVTADFLVYWNWGRRGPHD
jgi:hypothetical protein